MENPIFNYKMKGKQEQLVYLNRHTHNCQLFHVKAYNRFRDRDTITIILIKLVYIQALLHSLLDFSVIIAIFKTHLSS